MERKKTNNNDVKNEHWHGLKARLAALVKNRSFYVGLFIIALMVVLTVKLYSLQVAMLNMAANTIPIAMELVT